MSCIKTAFSYKIVFSTVLQLVQGNPFRGTQNSITMLRVMKNGKRYSLFSLFVCCGEEFSVYIVMIQEDSGERLSDFEEDDETMNERDYVINVEEETENSFVVPDGDLSGDEV